jgi:hypothetical protein
MRSPLLTNQTMTKNAKRSRKPRPRRSIMQTFQQTGITSISVASSSTSTMAVAYRSSQFGFAGSPTFLVTMPMLSTLTSNDPGYRVRVNSVVCHYEPFFGSSYAATPTVTNSGQGCGIAAVINSTNTVTLGYPTLQGYKSHRMFRVGEPFSLKWKATTVDDKLWLDPYTAAVVDVGSNGWQFAWYANGLSVLTSSTTMGMVFFYFDVTVMVM